MRQLQPPDWARSTGYGNGIAARGTMRLVAGQVGWNAREEVESDDFTAQERQASRSIVEGLAEAGARPSHLVQLNWLIADTHDYLAHRASLGAAYRAVIGDRFPAMSVIEVNGFIEQGAKLEIEATTGVPG